MADTVATYATTIRRGQPVPPPQAQWQRWPDAFVTLSKGRIYLEDRAKNPFVLMAFPGQCHAVRITNIIWHLTDKAHDEVTLLWL